MERVTRYSKKRVAILNALKSTTCHPSAEWLYQTLKPQHPDLSLGTVYRNLTLFREQGVIQSIGVINGQELFDATTSPHSHFVCNCCGRVFDLHDLPLDESVDQLIEEQYGLSVSRHELTVYGTCQDCLVQKRGTKH